MQQQEGRRRELQRVVASMERLVESWNAVVAQGTQACAALCNVAARRAAAADEDQQRQQATETAVADGDGGGVDTLETDEGRIEAAMRRRGEAERLERHMATLQRSLAALRDVADRLNKAAGAAAECFVRPTPLTAEEAAWRTASEPSLADLLETAQYIAASHEREYWAKRALLQRRLAAADGYTRPALLDALLEGWAAELCIDKPRISTLLARARGCSLRLTGDL